jgi:hypothetical protein
MGLLPTDFHTNYGFHRRRDIAPFGVWTIPSSYRGTFHDLDAARLVSTPSDQVALTGLARDWLGSFDR